jgi:ABC-type branched-subunit amino acid transport system substrate-binding protein
MIPVAARLFLALALTFSIPDAQAGKRKNPDLVEDALAFALTDRSKAITLLENTLSEEPDRKDWSVITLNAGEQRRLAGDLDAAHQWFTHLLQTTTKDMDVEAAKLGIALIQSSTGANAQTLSVLGSISDKDALDTQNADRHLLLAMDAARQDDASAVAQHSRLALQFGREDPAVYDRVREALTSVASITPNSVSAPRLAAGSSAFERAEEALASGHKDDAKKLGEKALAETTPDSPEHRAAAYLMRRIDGARVSPDKIAVLLPLSGKYEAVGRQVREALEFGYRQGRGDRKLLFVDSGASPETAVKALEDVVIDEGVIGVVGPLLTDETQAVVEASEALHVPLISLSTALDDASQTTWTLQGMVTPRDQIIALLEQVMDKDGLTSFVTFAPESPYGMQASAIFEEEVTARGGTITATEFYDPIATEMLEDAKILGRKDYDLRAREFYDLKKATKEAGGNPDSVVLPPVLDFQAIFVPEKASRIPLACAALAYEEFPMGDFQPTKKSPVIPVLGLSGWNNPNLVQTGGPYARRSYFTDAFLLQTNGEDPPWIPEPKVQAFVEAFRTEYGRTPSPREAIVADIGRLLAFATAEGASTRGDLRDALFAAKPDNTVTGLTGINPDTRRSEREMMILTITKDGIIPRSDLPPPEQPR